MELFISPQIPSEKPTVHSIKDLVVCSKLAGYDTERLHTRRLLQEICESIGGLYRGDGNIQQN